MRKLYKSSKSYKTAATLFLISGLIFIVVDIVSTVTGGTPVFLSIGIALIVISMVYWKQSRKPTDNFEEKPEHKKRIQ
jgi:membrane-bound ClpP family serine protease